MSADGFEIQFRGVVDAQTHWEVLYVYRAGGRDWLSANISVQKTAKDIDVIPIAKALIHKICVLTVEKTRSWNIDDDVLSAKENGLPE